MKKSLTFLTLLISTAALAVDTPTRLSNQVIIGNGVAGDKTLFFDIGGSATPTIESTSGILKLSTDHTNFMTVPAATDTFVGRVTTDTQANRLQNKDLDAGSFRVVDSSTTTKKIGFSVSAATASTETIFATQQSVNRTITFPDVTDTVCTLGATQTLTAKALTAPAISSPALTGAWTATGDLTQTESGGIQNLLNANGSSVTNKLILRTGNGTSSGRNSMVEFDSAESSGQTWDIGMVGTKDLRFYDQTAGKTVATVTPTTYDWAIGDSTRNTGTGILTVSGDDNNGSGPNILKVVDGYSAPTGNDVAMTINFTHGGASTTGVFLQFQKNGSSIGTVQQNASTTVAYNTSSDARLKHDITDFSDGLSVLRKVQVRKFKWNDGNQEDRGVIAQELKKVYPFPVSGSPAGDVRKSPMSVDYGKLTPLALSAIKAVDANEVLLEARVKALEEEVKALEKALKLQKKK